ncbi:Methyltransferase domain containing protein [Ceratobasidium theobromae]|uniref:Methyltransferase domain containing protein n=1 Tax=Ceratobasidium theobromae TaxID=1582974 RepID=A0A5N5QRD0_9AGAM|nr:Methyltransferase domain containing protein [Ceratobasidium theobromae]
MVDARDDPPTPLPLSPTLVPIPHAEYAEYYFQRYGRQFPRHRLPHNLRNTPDSLQLPSVLPVDAAEMERRVVQHNLVSLALHQHWFGPFRQHLTPPNNKVVLDIGSASGKWIEEVSEEPYQDVRFHGVEIVPLSPTEQTTHTFFEVYDFQQERIRQADASVDIIHARFQNFHILDWSAFVKDVARALKPGGLFMSGELDIALESPDGEPLNAPATNQFYGQIQRLMRERGYTPDIGSLIPGLLQDISDPQGVTLFTNVGSDVVTIPMNRNNPIVEQRELSTLAMECLDRLAISLRAFGLSTGQPQIEVDGIITGHRRELRRINAQMKYRITWAERR